MSDDQHIDHLADELAATRAQLNEVRHRIRSSARKAAIAFVDLVGSTAKKENEDPEHWLMEIYLFIKAVEAVARASGGTIVKRLGDGALVSFQTVEEAEGFLAALDSSESFSQWSFRTAADYGDVYLFKFEPTLPDDPHGRTVDRCARMMPYARGGTILCGSNFVTASKQKADYRSAGQFTFAGFSKPEELFIRFGKQSAFAESYLRPLIKALNDDQPLRSGYRKVQRKFSANDFGGMHERAARPFLCRELLNVPMLPWSYDQFCKQLESMGNEEELLDCIGMMVEWECYFSSFHRISDDLIIVHLRSKDHSGLSVKIRVPAFMSEVLRNMRDGQPVSFRAVIMDANKSWLDFDYAEFKLP